MMPSLSLLGLHLSLEEPKDLSATTAPRIIIVSPVLLRKVGDQVLLRNLCNPKLVGNLQLLHLWDHLNIVLKGHELGIRPSNETLMSQIVTSVWQMMKSSRIITFTALNFTFTNECLIRLELLLQLKEWAFRFSFQVLNMLVQEILTRTQDSTVKLSLLKTVIQIIIHEPQIIISLALDFLLFDLLITWHKAQRLVITEVFID